MSLLAVHIVTSSSKWRNVFVCLQYDTGNGQKMFVSELGQRLGSKPNILKLSGTLEAVYKLPDKEQRTGTFLYCYCF
jgi:hypothetical protein